MMALIAILIAWETIIVSVMLHRILRAVQNRPTTNTVSFVASSDPKAQRWVSETLAKHQRRQA